MNFSKKNFLKILNKFCKIKVFYFSISKTNLFLLNLMEMKIKMFYGNVFKLKIFNHEQK